MKHAPFWMNYSEGQGCPTKKYFTYDEAATEAKRLTRILNVEVFTLQVVSSQKKVDVQTTVFDFPTDLPF